MEVDKNKGTEALEGAGKSETKKAPAKAAGKAPKKAAGKSRDIHHIITRPLKDGTVHHEHVYKTPQGGPDFQGSDEYSSANAADAGDHVAQALGGGDPDPASDPAAGAPAQGGAPAPAPAEAPAQGDPNAGM